MIVRPKQDAARRSKGARRVDPIGHFAKRCQLGAIHRVRRLVGTSQMAHDQNWPVGKQGIPVLGPVTRFQPQTVHAGIKLNAKSVARKVRPMAGNLLRGVQHRDGIGGF